ncbi:MAG: HAMP domain-containing histidine kinase [Eubacterium sp.]|nr:HAMP domain-containing histidine kinase [Eubacterium sp.]
MKKKRFLDFNSIYVRLLIYFMLFAIVIIFLIGGMEIFLFNNFYGTMKARDTGKLADTIRRNYSAHSSDEDFDLSEFIQNFASENDIYILIAKPAGDTLSIVSSSFGSSAYPAISSTEYNEKLWDLYEQISRDTSDDDIPIPVRSAETMLTSENGSGKVLAYACFLEKPGHLWSGLSDNSSDESSGSYGDQQFRAATSNSVVMYILNPLYPTTSTVRILYNILVTIMFFAVFLVAIMALYLATRISKPIRDITRSAEQLGQGDFDVKFKSGSYSEIDELAETLTIAENEMKKTEMYHKDLIANVSHDIKTPLTMIKSYAEMIRDLSGNDPVKREKHLDIIIEEADRLNVLVNDMLSLSRLQSHKLALEKSTFDINEAARDVLSSYDILQEQEGYDIKFIPSEPLMVEGDESKICQVMNNLMTNAVKYCGEDKKIIVTIERNGKAAEFRVTDHGQGIKPDELPHVWDRYYQSSTHHVRETTGTGLGLSIVKEILKLHDAKYGVDSTVGEGSSFWFELPIVR